MELAKKLKGGRGGGRGGRKKEGGGRQPEVDGVVGVLKKQTNKELGRIERAQVSSSAFADPTSHRAGSVTKRRPEKERK